MARAYLAHVQSGDALTESDVALASALVDGLPQLDEGLNDLQRLGVQWVVQNPIPVALPPPAYRR
jgi:hypothetical protein